MVATDTFIALKNLLRDTKKRNQKFNDYLNKEYFPAASKTYAGSKVSSSKIAQMATDMEASLRANENTFLVQTDHILPSKVLPIRERRSVIAHYFSPVRLHQTAIGKPEGELYKEDSLLFHRVEFAFGVKEAVYNNQSVNVAITKHAMERFFERSTSVTSTAFINELTTPFLEALEHLAFCHINEIYLTTPGKEPGRASMGYAIPFGSGMMLFNVRIFLYPRRTTNAAPALAERITLRNATWDQTFPGPGDAVRVAGPYRNPDFVPVVTFVGTTFVDFNQTFKNQDDHMYALRYMRQENPQDFLAYRNFQFNPSRTFKKANTVVPSGIDYKPVADKLRSELEKWLKVTDLNLVVVKDL